jgi:phage-related tail protein
MRGEARRQRSLERDLRETHLVPMAKFARAHLSRDGNIAALAPKLKNLGGHRLARMAEAMATSGVPFRGKFAEAGYPAGFLEEASAAAQALVASIDRRSALRNDRVAATVGIAAALEQGRQAIAMLDPVVGRIIAGNEGLVSGWKHAKRISAVPGPVRQSKRGRARKKN